MKTQQIVIILLLIICIALGFYSFHLKQLNDNLMESKNFNFKWNSGQEILMGYWLNNHKISNHYIDRNFDNNYELINSYTTYGKLYSANYDRNENGVFEKMIFFNSVREKVGNSIDSDEDGAIDEFTIFLDNGNELKFLDIDIDGRYERVYSKRNDTIIELNDENLFK